MGRQRSDDVPGPRLVLSVVQMLGAPSPCWTAIATAVAAMMVQWNDRTSNKAQLVATSRRDLMNFLGSTSWALAPLGLTWLPPARWR